MMDMRTMDKLKEMLLKELDEISIRGELTGANLESAHKITDTIKNIEKIKMLCENEEGYSQSRGGRYSMGMYPMDDEIDPNYSRRTNISYGNRGMRNMRGSNYSYAEAKRDIRERIREMMNTNDITQNEYTTLDKALRELEK